MFVSGVVTWLHYGGCRANELRRLRLAASTMAWAGRPTRWESQWVPPRRRAPQRVPATTQHSIGWRQGWRLRASESTDDAESERVAKSPREVNDVSAIEYFDPVSASATSVADDGDDTFELPLFPLPVVLSPGNSVPLHIFEMRYRQMFQTVRERDNRFGIVMYDRERRCHTAVGTVAEVMVYETLEDGRIMTSSFGRERFRVLKYVQEEPYIKALVQYVDDATPLDGEAVPPTGRDEAPGGGGGGLTGAAAIGVHAQTLAELEQRVWTALNDVLRLSNRLYNRNVDLSERVKEHSPENAVSAGEGGKEMETLRANFERQKRFSFAVIGILDMPLRQQQLLVQTRDTAGRLMKQAELLENARRYLVAQVTIKNAFSEDA
ncbi:hypothetical protein CDCA_CDCA17G4333 [Cyanidium caldarium]|uniref:Lon N-terminal domain-containing protein n=1 Tax=Cyanidium caldarium TaxID=2771 RepID=A0AAV9J2N2_CYACA|nr:hypothetical protein CDCA_CDCA17G4333 [Cyanidium caldarium]